jgi:hypothetical protein
MARTGQDRRLIGLAGPGRYERSWLRGGGRGHAWAPADGTCWPAARASSLPGRAVGRVVAVVAEVPSARAPSLGHTGG